MTRSRLLRYSRRQMLQRSISFAGAVAAPLLIPGATLGKNGSTAPSNRITVGFIGVGMMGRGHFRIFTEYDDVEVMALSDVDPWRREDTTQVLEKAYAARQPGGDHRGFRAHSDFRELLARDDIDAVVIATGERWHPAITVLAAQAGKDIYCEKPISLTVRQARAMVESVRRHNRVFQTGLQQRNSPEYRQAMKMVHAGRIGDVKLAYVSDSGVSPYQNFAAEPLPEGLDWEMWLGPCPWHPYSYRYHQTGVPHDVVPWSCNRAFGAGGMTSGTVHNLDSAHEGLRKDGDGPVTLTPAGVDGEPSLAFTYADGTRIVFATTLQPGKHPIPKGWNPATPIQNFGVLFVGDRGWIHVERFGVLNCYPKNLLDATIPKSHSVQENHRDWLDCIRTRRRPRGRGNRRVLHHFVPSGLHRIVDRPGADLGSHEGRVSARRGGELAAVAGRARTVECVRQS